MPAGPADLFGSVEPVREFKVADPGLVREAVAEFVARLETLDRGPGESDGRVGSVSSDQVAPVWGSTGNGAAGSLGDLGFMEALNLTRDVFGEEIARLSRTASDLTTDLEDVVFLSEYVARVKKKSSGTELLSSMTPFLSRDHVGNLAPIDLDLDLVGERWVPGNPGVTSSLPDRSTGEIRTGPVSFLASRTNVASFGLDDRTRFYPNVDHDTDLTLAPTPTGVGVLYTLRSDRSPSVQSLEFGRTPDVKLSMESDGSVDLSRNGEPSVSVPAPEARDATGASVDVQLRVDRDTLSMVMPHASKGVEYPLLVYSVVQIEESVGRDLRVRSIDDVLDEHGDISRVGGWYASTSRDRLKTIHVSGDRRAGLFLPGHDTLDSPYPNAWVWITPRGGSGLTRVDFGPYDLDLGGDARSSETHPLTLTVGADGSSTESIGGRTTNGFTTVDIDEISGVPIKVGMASFELDRLSASDPSPAQLPEAFLHGMVAHYTDSEGASLEGRLGELGGKMTEKIWSGRLSDAKLVPVEAHDSGVGVKYLKILVEGHDGDQQVLDRYVDPCDGSPENPCPTDLSRNLKLDPASLVEGRYTIKVRAYDALGQTAGGPNVRMAIDRMSPALELSGPITEQENAVVNEHSTIRVFASDHGSGTLAVYLSVDDKLVDQIDQPCGPDDPCDVDGNLTVGNESLPAGSHTYKVRAVDIAGNTVVVSGRFTVDKPPKIGAPERRADAICSTSPPGTDNSGTAISIEDATSLAPAYATEPSRPTDDQVDESEVDPELVQIKPPPAPLRLGGSRATGKVGSTPTAGFSLNGALCLVPAVTTSDETVAAITSETEESDDDTIIKAALYANAAPDSDFIVRPTAAGLATIINRRGAAAPSSYSWKVSFAKGLALEKIDNGSIAVVDKEQNVLNIDPTPDRPEDADDPEMLTDASTQLAEAEFQIDSAQAATGRTVMAVISAPILIDSNGKNTRGAISLNSDTITINAEAPDVESIILPTFDNSVSSTIPNTYVPPSFIYGHYMSYFPREQAAAAALRYACNPGDFGNITVPSSWGVNLPAKLILDFGTARRVPRDTNPVNDMYTGSTWVNGGGIFHFDSTEISLSLVLAAYAWSLNSYDGIPCNHPPGAKMEILYGLNNDNLNLTIADNVQATLAGQAQLSIAQSIQPYADSLTPGISDDLKLGVAHDVEMGWATTDLARQTALSMVKNATSGGVPAVAYGTAGNCRLLNDPGASSAERCWGWTVNQVGHIVKGWPGHPIETIPQIYYQRNIADWEQLKLAWNSANPQRKIYFAGVTAQHYSAQFPCYKGGVQVHPFPSSTALSKFRVEVAPNVENRIVSFPCFPILINGQVPPGYIP